jgi:hypothetical protein
MLGRLFSYCAQVLLELRDPRSGKVFNMLVEKAVEKPGTVDLNGSLTAALAFCTGLVAGTLVVVVERDIASTGTAS